MDRNRRLYGTAPSHAGVIASSVPVLPVLPLSTIASTIHYCDPRLKVRMAPERQDKDKYTHAEVRFEHHREGQEYLRRVRALHPRVAGRLARWWLRAREGSDRAAGLV